MNTIWKTVLAGVLSTALVDLQAYQAARKLDKTAPFDWPLFGIRLLIGVIGGVMAGVGVGAVSE